MTCGKIDATITALNWARARWSAPSSNFKDLFDESMIDETYRKEVYTILHRTVDPHFNPFKTALTHLYQRNWVAVESSTPNIYIKDIALKVISTACIVIKTNYTLLIPTSATEGNKNPQEAAISEKATLTIHPVTRKITKLSISGWIRQTEQYSSKPRDPQQENLSFSLPFFIYWQALLRQNHLIAKDCVKEGATIQLEEETLCLQEYVNRKREFDYTSGKLYFTKKESDEKETLMHVPFLAWKIPSIDRIKREPSIYPIVKRIHIFTIENHLITEIKTAVLLKSTHSYYSLKNPYLVGCSSDEEA